MNLLVQIETTRVRNTDRTVAPLVTLSLCLLDAEAEVESAPGAPLDVRCLDANKDYIIVTWKQPAVDGGDSILGYFVDRSVNTQQRRE